jgi:hypothetical protein
LEVDTVVVHEVGLFHFVEEGLDVEHEVLVGEVGVLGGLLVELGEVLRVEPGEDFDAEVVETEVGQVDFGVEELGLDQCKDVDVPAVQVPHNEFEFFVVLDIPRIREQALDHPLDDFLVLQVIRYNLLA